MPEKFPIRHPEITEYAGGVFPETDEEAFATLSKLGWQRVPDDDTDYSTLSVDQLRELVEQAKEDGRDVKPASAKKADLVKALEADRAAVRSEAETPEQIQGP